MNYREKARQIREERVALMTIRIALSLRSKVRKLMDTIKTGVAALLVLLASSAAGQSIALTPEQLEKAADQRLTISALSMGFGVGIGSVLMLQDEEGLQMGGQLLTMMGAGIGFGTFIGSARQRERARKLRRAQELTGMR